MAADDPISLEGKVEKAFHDLISSTLVPVEEGAEGWQHFTGLENELQSKQCTYSQCMGGPEEPLNSGNQMMEVEVGVRTKLAAEDPNAPTEDRALVHNQNVRAVQAVLRIDNLAAVLTELVEDFYCYHPIVPGRTRQDVDGDFARTVFPFKVYCMASTATD